MGEIGFDARVVKVLTRLRAGEVVSYGEVAAEAGFPGAARAVGNLLGRDAADVPWWRVVRGDGAVVSRHPAEQIARLEAEGVVVVDGRVRPWRRGSRRDSPTPGRRRAAPRPALRRAGRQATE
jgi:methylated-DNA-protein-cysteine methyltransferase-like protein